MFLSAYALIFAVSTAGAYLWSGFPHILSHNTKYRNQNEFLPAPPGITPQCASPGATFCEHVGTYPRNTIQHLIQKNKHTYSLFITSETDQEFTMRDSPYYENSYPNIPTKGGYGSPSFSNYNASYRTGYSTAPFATGSQQYVQPPHSQISAAMVPLLQSFWWDQARRNTYLGQYHQHTRNKRQAAEDQLCAVNSRFVTPEAAMNNEGDWMYIVNNPDNPRFAQQVRIETCVSAGNECSGLCQTPPGYRATCRQKFTQKRLIALDGSGAALRNGVFWIPLCCYCEIQRG